MEFNEINPDDLPEGHPLREIAKAAVEAHKKMETAFEGARDSRNEILFTEICDLRDATRDEIEFLRAVHAIVEATDVSMTECNKSGQYIRSRILRIIASSLSHKADEIDTMMRTQQEVAREMEETMEEGDADHE